jgi:protein TonB
MLPLIARDAELRAESNRFLRYALFLTIPLFFLFFYFFPPFDFKPYELPYQPPIEIVFPDEIIIPDEPREITQPAIPVEISDEEGAEAADVEVPVNVFSSAAEIPVTIGIDDEPESEPEFYAFDEPPVLIESIKPVYPEVAMQVGIEGTVLLRLLVDVDGSVIEAGIIQSDVTPDMEKAAISAAWEYRFKPAKQRNVPVKAHVALPVIFKIN